MNQKIEFVFFDLGNVILNFNHQIACRNIADLTGVPPADCHRIIFDSSMQNEYESGLIGSHEFVDRFSRSSGIEPDPDQLLLASSDIFWLNRAIVPLITQLAVIGFPVGILSNTCASHWEFISRRFPLLDKLFLPEHQVLSYKAKSMKPDAGIFEQAIAAAGVKPGRIFFTDDIFKNVGGARELAIQAEVYESVPVLTRQLADRGVLLNL